MSIRLIPEIGDFLRILSRDNPSLGPITEIPLGQVERLLACEDWFQILLSPEHFLAASYLQLMNQSDKRITRESDKLIMHRPKYEYNNDKETIEYIRILLLKGLESGCSELFISTEGALKGIFGEEDQIVPWSESPDTPKLDHYLLTELPNILKSLGLFFREEGFKKQLPDWRDLIPVTKYTVHWQLSPKHIFKVPPVGLPREEPPGRLNSLLFERRNETGDFAFMATENGSIKLHKCVLDVQGPEALQVMLQSSMAEADQNTYKMDAWSKEAVELFVRNIYFGHNHVAHHLLSYDVIPKEAVFELLEMAHMYMQPRLFDCAANALSACASTTDLPRLLQLAEETNGGFLLQLYDKLRQLRQALELRESIATLKV